MCRAAISICLPLALGMALVGCGGGLLLRAPSPSAAPLAELAELLERGRWERDPDFDAEFLHERAASVRDDFRWEFRIAHTGDTASARNASQPVETSISDETNDTASAAEPSPGDPESKGVETSESTSASSESTSKPNPELEPTPKPQADALPQSDEKTKWFGSRPVEITEFLDRLDRDGPHHGDASDKAEAAPPSYLLLRELARRDELVGWQAAILLSRRFPRMRGPEWQTLERIVTDPPQYDPETGHSTTPRDSSAVAENSFAGWWHATTNAHDDETTSKKTEKGKELPESLRSAAVEAWCRVLAASTDDPADGLAPAGRLLEESDLPLFLRKELFRNVARGADPARIPWLAEALDEANGPARAPVELRRAAIEACLIHASCRNSSTPDLSMKAAPSSLSKEPWPKTIANCQWDPDTEVRRLYGRWVTVTRQPHAERILVAQLSDHDYTVRDAAMVSLGILGTPEAIAELERQSHRNEELIRAAAIRGIARIDAQRLEAHARDSAASVRKVVATELSRYPAARSALVLRELLTDMNVQVQAAVVETIHEWPDRLAIPLLLHAMRESSTRVRMASFRELRRRRTIDEPYRVDAPTAERRVAVARIAQEAALSPGLLDELQQAGLHGRSPNDARRKSRIVKWLQDVERFPPRSAEHAAAVENLRSVTSAEVAIIEQAALSGDASVPELVFDEILPNISAAYAALAELESSDVFIRRRGAQQLAQDAEAASLGRLMLKRLAEALTHEQDRLTWRFAMQAILPDDSDAGAQIAMLAINHTWPDIRELGCRYLRRHPSQERAVWLHSLLDDPNRNVQQMAIEAAGRCGNPIVIDDPHDESGRSTGRGLRSLLGDSDRNVRFAAARALSRLGGEEGIQEMIRMAHDERASRRLEVVRAMGEAGLTRFRHPLIELAWTEPDVRVRAAILESLDRLTPADLQPTKLEQARNDAARVEAWVAWESHRTVHTHASPYEPAVEPRAVQK